MLRGVGPFNRTNTVDIYMYIVQQRFELYSVYDFCVPSDSLPVFYLMITFFLPADVAPGAAARLCGVSGGGGSGAGRGADHPPPRGPRSPNTHH